MVTQQVFITDCIPRTQSAYFCLICEKCNFFNSVCVCLCVCVCVCVCLCVCTIPERAEANNSFEHELHAINCELEKIDFTVNTSCNAGKGHK